MEALQETTVWKGKTPNHIYLLDGLKCLAYIKQGETKPTFFKTPMQGFDRRRRSFVRVSVKLFGEQKKSTLIEVTGSKGDTYLVDPDKMTCTCSGFKFRGSCKHLKEVK